MCCTTDIKAKQRVDVQRPKNKTTHNLQIHSRTALSISYLITMLGKYFTQYHEQQRSRGGESHFLL